MALERRDGVLHELHFRQRKQKSQGRFRALVLVDAIHMQRIAAAARAGRVHFQSEIIPAEKPIEGALGLLVPPAVRRGAIGFQTGRHHGLRFNGLLIESGAQAAAPVKSVAADRAEVAVLGICNSASQRKARRPRSSTAVCPVACPLTIKACASFALS